MRQDSHPRDLLIGLYVAAESRILAGLARIIRRLTGVDWLQRGFVGRMLVRRLVNQVNGELAQQTPALVAAVVAHAYRTAGVTPPSPPPPGGGTVPFPFEPHMSHGDRAARQIVNDLNSELSDVRYRLTRLDDDIYKAIAPDHAIAQVEGRGVTPLQAQAAAWEEFTRRGVTGFTDKSGRDWQLSSYVEMAVRTASVRAFNAARMEHVASQGGNLLYVTDDGHPCPLCQPWQNRVLAISPDGEHPTVDDATAAGLFHPNCRHALTEFVPGRTILPEPREWTADDQAAYQATQRQRALERAIRAAKRDALYAPTPEARQAAAHDVRTAQARLRAFLADHENLSLLRRYHREQPDLSYPTTR